MVSSVPPVDGCSPAPQLLAAAGPSELQREHQDPQTDLTRLLEPPGKQPRPPHPSVKAPNEERGGEGGGGGRGARTVSRAEPANRLMLTEAADGSLQS